MGEFWLYSLIGIVLTLLLTSVILQWVKPWRMTVPGAAAFNAFLYFMSVVALAMSVILPNQRIYLSRTAAEPPYGILALMFLPMMQYFFLRFIDKERTGEPPFKKLDFILTAIGTFFLLFSLMLYVTSLILPGHYVGPLGLPTSYNFASLTVYVSLWLFRISGALLLSETLLDPGRLTVFVYRTKKPITIIFLITLGITFVGALLGKL